MDNFIKIEIAISIIVFTVFAVLAFIRYIKTKDADSLVSTIKKLVAAAEQLFLEPKSGKQKLFYVVNTLEEMGVKVTSFVEALIESEVFNLKKK